MEIPKYVELYRKDLELKNYAKTSIENYVSQVKTFLYHYDGKFTEPQKINEAAIKDWLLLSKSTNGRKHRLSALKLFYKFTIKQPMKLKYIEYPRKEQRLPIIIDQSDIQKMFDVCDNLKHECIMAVLYATGIRIDELINLKITDIESKSENKAIRIIGKGNKERLVGLSDDLLKKLRQYYKEYKPLFWLFENDGTHKQYTASSVRAFLKDFKQKAGVTSPVTPHKYRHSHATALLEAGTDLRIIQELLGHNSSKTTEIYTHVSRKLISNIHSPLTGIKMKG